MKIKTARMLEFILAATVIMSAIAWNLTRKNIGPVFGYVTAAAAIGWLVIIFCGYRCPHCGGKMGMSARSKCPHCGKEIEW